MNARVASMGGTTLAMIMPSTWAISRPAGEKRLRRRMPHSSAVCSWTVRKRQWKMRSRPWKAPMVILLFPASRANSTYASCKNQGIGSIVLAHDEEARGVEAGGGPGDGAVRLIDGHAPSGDVAGGMSEEVEDGFGVFGDEGIDGGEESEQNVLAGEFAAGVLAGRDGQAIDVAGKRGLIDVDADAGDGLAIDQLYQDASGLAIVEHEVVGPAPVALDAGGLGDGLAIGQLPPAASGLAIVEHEVVGPAQVALDAGGLGDGLDGGDAEGEGDDGRGRQHEGTVDADAGFGVPGVAVASLAGELAIGQDDGAGLGCGGDALGGIEGLEVEDVALGEGLAQAGEINHGSGPRAGRGRPGPEGTPTRGSTPRPPANCMMPPSLVGMRDEGVLAQRAPRPGGPPHRLTSCPTIEQAIIATPGGS